MMRTILLDAILDSGLSFNDILLKVLLPLGITYLIALFIGLERQNVGKAAGLSSHVLVAVGSAGIAIMQRLMYESQIAAGFNSPEGQRIIAQVVTGIGFVGAGVIMKRHSNVITGITTAATLWVTAMVGLILGSGYIILGSIVGVFMVVLMVIRDVLRGFNPFHARKKEEVIDDKNDEPEEQS